MFEFLKLGTSKNTPVRNQQVSDSRVSVQPSVNNYNSNPQIQRNNLPDNVANRVIPYSSIDTVTYTKMYQALSSYLDDEDKKNLQSLHVNKKLSSNRSNDGSSTIENLYKIAATPRAAGIDPKIILKETLRLLADPYIDTQDRGKIPAPIMAGLIRDENVRVQNRLAEEQQNPKPDYEKKEILKPVTPQDIDFNKGHTCPAASIEFDLADKKPAELARYVERLTSPDKCVKTKIRYTNIADDVPAAISKLKDWRVDYKKVNPEVIEVTLRPDENAYPVALVQEYARAKDSRSTIDSLLQSTFMQAGSEKTYNSLTDLRSEDTGHGRGLNQEEGAFVESVVDYEGGKDSVTYMELDDNLTKVMSRAFDAKTIEQQLTETLQSGRNIMIGFLTDVDKNDKLLSDNGHEVLLTGIVQDKTGKKYFRYNDTDDGDNYAPSYIPVDELIHTLHHANLPKDVIRKYLKPEQLKDQRLNLIADYWQLKKQNASAPAQQEPARA